MWSQAHDYPLLSRPDAERMQRVCRRADEIAHYRTGEKRYLTRTYRIRRLRNAVSFPTDRGMVYNQTNTYIVERRAE